MIVQWKPWKANENTTARALDVPSSANSVTRHKNTACSIDRSKNELGIVRKLKQLESRTRIITSLKKKTFGLTISFTLRK